MPRSQHLDPAWSYVVHALGGYQLIRRLLFFVIQRAPSPTLFPYTTLFRSRFPFRWQATSSRPVRSSRAWPPASAHRSEEHTSELQSRGQLVCRLLLENKNQSALTRSVVYIGVGCFPRAEQGSYFDDLACRG